MAYFLGIDGGGTKTRFLLADQDGIIASASGPGCKVSRVGLEQVRTTLQQGTNSVCRDVNISPGDIASVCAGMTGAGREGAASEIAVVISKLVPSAKIKVVGDIVIAHEAALGGAPGVVVIAGTGSIAYGLNEAGETARAGGWGHAISDEGSGHWIGIKAVAAVLHAHDCGRGTELDPRILSRWNVRSHDQLVQLSNASPAPDFSSLFPDVVAAFENGDPLAQEILVSAGTELAKVTASVLQRLRFGHPTEVAMMGGVFLNSEAVRCAFEVELREQEPDVSITLSRADPAEGAVAMARRLHR